MNLWELPISLVCGFVTLVVIFAPLEWHWAARHQAILYRGLRLDLMYLASQYLLWNAAAIYLLITIRSLCFGASALVSLQSEVKSVPVVFQAIVAVMLGDLATYWFHRACHHFHILWKFHRVHHSAHQLGFIAAHREHPLDGFLTQLAVNAPAFLLGIQLRFLAPLIVFRGLWAIFIHSNVHVPLGVLGSIFGSPRFHHWHHANVEKTAHNFGNLAPWTDFVFGTHHQPAVPETFPLGINEELSQSWFRQLLEPFVKKV